MRLNWKEGKSERESRMHLQMSSEGQNELPNIVLEAFSTLSDFSVHFVEKGSYNSTSKGNSFDHVNLKCLCVVIRKYLVKNKIM